MVKKKSRKELLLLNSVTSMVSQVITVVCGFVLTNFILKGFGSEVNGMTASISQFLGFISFLEMGIGAVVKSALYKPLAEGDSKQVSKIIISCRNFYRKIAMILLLYTIVLMVVFPIIAKEQFSIIYTASLVAIISISLFAQYFFGIPYQLLLNADQKTYIPTIVCSSTLIANTILSLIAIRLGAGIHFVKLITSLVYVIRPLFYKLYVKRHYNLNEKILLTEEPLQQKWNGLAQHIAYVVVNYTDIVVLTLLSTFANVSIYTVYHNVTIGVQQIISSMSVGVAAMVGNVLYTEGKEKIKETFSAVECFFHAITVLLFTITGLLIVPFVRVYTEGVTDANYNVPLFAALITFAQATYSIRTPYETIVTSANHFKQTQTSAIIEALLNIIISVVLVFRIGLIGVAMGTIIAMTYRTIYFVVYLKTHILNYKISHFVKLVIQDASQVILCIVVSKVFVNTSSCISWTGWLKDALQIGVICVIVCGAINVIFSKKEIRTIFHKT